MLPHLRRQRGRVGRGRHRRGEVHLDPHRLEGTSQFTLDLPERLPHVRTHMVHRARVPAPEPIDHPVERRQVRLARRLPLRIEPEHGHLRVATAARRVLELLEGPAVALLDGAGEIASPRPQRAPKASDGHAEVVEGLRVGLVLEAETRGMRLVEEGEGDAPGGLLGRPMEQVWGKGHGTSRDPGECGECSAPSATNRGGADKDRARTVDRKARAPYGLARGLLFRERHALGDGRERMDAVAPGSLGRGQVAIRLAEEKGDRPRVAFVSRGDAHAHRDLVVDPVGSGRAGQGRAQSIRHAPGLLHALGFHDHDELVAAEAVHGVALADRLVDRARDVANGLVASLVPELVVVAPEGVDVAERDRERGAVAIDVGVLLPEVLLQAPPVRQGGEGVEARLFEERHVLPDEVVDALLELVDPLLLQEALAHARALPEPLLDRLAQVLERTGLLEDPEHPGANVTERVDCAFLAAHHDDGRPVPYLLLRAAKKVGPQKRGEDEVAEDQVVDGLGEVDAAVRLLPVGGELDVVAPLLECRRQELAEGLVVLYDQDARHAVCLLRIEDRSRGYLHRNPGHVHPSERQTSELDPEIPGRASRPPGRPSGRAR